MERSPDPLNIAYALGWLGFAHRERGDHARAIAPLEESVASMTEFRFQRNVCVFRGFLAGPDRSAGRLEEAREAAEGALSLSEELRYPWSIALARRVAGRIDLAAGDLAAPSAAWSAALEAFTGMEAGFKVAITHLDLAELGARPGAARGGGATPRGLPGALHGTGRARLSRPRQPVWPVRSRDPSWETKPPVSGCPTSALHHPRPSPARRSRSWNPAPAPQWHVLDDA